MMFLTSLSKRARIRAVSFAVAGLLVLSGFCFQGWHRANAYQQLIEYEYQHAFSELVSSVVSIDSALQKGTYARSPSMVASLANEVSRRAARAQSDLSALPFSFQELEGTSKFLSQLGDYAYMINKHAATGQPLAEEQLTALRGLSHTATELSANLTALMSIVNEENLNVAEQLMAHGDNAQGYGTGVSDTVKVLETQFSEMPSLIYDGPFSDHIEKREARFLKDKPILSAADATTAAANYLDIQPALLQPMGEIGGTIPCYQFRAHLDGGEANITIAKQGGYAVTLLQSRPIGDPKLTFEEAIQKAQAYLQAHGFDGMKESYYTRSGNMLFINFAYKSDAIVYYPDLIKVGIALDTGKVHIFESTGYLMNHHQRTLATPLVPLETARAAIADDLFVSAAEMCVIPTDGLNESLCYGFTCVDAESQSFLIYVNVETGYEERILLLLEDENGTLTA